jgi:D-sedoheptulose 7-phosphate isomerase
MKTTAEFVEAEINASIAAKQKFRDDRRQTDAFCRAVELVVATYRVGGRLYIAGNGGSACDAQHLAAEFVCKLGRLRAPLAAEALTADMAILTAISNDFAYEEVVARQLDCKATTRDLFIALTTSGNSPNIIKALEKCRNLGIPSVLFAGRGGGMAARIAEVCIVAPGENSCRVQEVHIVLYHALVACVENALFFSDDESIVVAPAATRVAQFAK